MVRIFVTIVLMAVVFGYPQFAEGTDGPCGALAALVTKRAVAPQAGDTATVKAAPGAPGGTTAYKAIADRNPAVPPQLSCTWLFWRAMFDSASLTDTARILGSPPPGQ